jgi:hypothetical protein
MKYPAAMTGINQTVGSPLGEPVALIEFSKQQPTRIRGDIAAIKIGCDLFRKKTSKAELFMADCIHKGVLAKESFVLSQQHFSRCPFLLETLFMKYPG